MSEVSFYWVLRDSKRVSAAALSDWRRDTQERSKNPSAATNHKKIAHICARFHRKYSPRLSGAHLLNTSANSLPLDLILSPRVWAVRQGLCFVVHMPSPPPVSVTVGTFPRARPMPGQRCGRIHERTGGGVKIKVKNGKRNEISFGMESENRAVAESSLLSL